MSTSISATELARHLSDILNRARFQGEEFTVVRNGQEIAKLGPVGTRPATTWREFLERYRAFPRPDDGFADDLEAIQTAQGTADMPEWPC